MAPENSRLATSYLAKMNAPRIWEHVPVVPSWDLLESHSGWANVVGKACRHYRDRMLPERPLTRRMRRRNIKLAVTALSVSVPSEPDPLLDALKFPVITCPLVTPNT